MSPAFLNSWKFPHIPEPVSLILPQKFSLPWQQGHAQWTIFKQQRSNTSSKRDP
jgi:hypothetical protein